MSNVIDRLPNYLRALGVSQLDKADFPSGIHVGHQCYDSIKPYVAGKNVGFIFDPDTYQARGDHLRSIIRHVAKDYKEIVLPPYPKPSTDMVEYIVKQTHDQTILVALGGGTINDLCKRVTYLANKSFIMVASAASMNGYTSNQASIIDKGIKASIKGRVASHIIMDIDVLSESPLRLTLSGFADVICRHTVQSDALLAHYLFDQAYDEGPFRALFPYEQKLIEGCTGFELSDTTVIEALIDALSISGLGMSLVGSSITASGGEHMIAHTMEMGFPERSVQPDWPYHGEQVAITSLIMSRIQGRKIRNYLDAHPSLALDKTLAECFLRDRASPCEAITRKKRERLALLRGLPDLNQRLEEVEKKLMLCQIPEERYRVLLQKANIPTSPEKIGWDPTDLEKATRLARHTRDRYTWLDLI